MKVGLVTSWGTPCGIAVEDVPRIEQDLRRLSTGCWEWCGPVQPKTGYGIYYTLACRLKRAHKVVWQLVRGPVPPGCVLDHQCENKRCCNPAHLEAVTNRVNTLRGTSPPAVNARKTHCKRGHRLTGANVKLKRGPYGVLRMCVPCARVYRHQRYLTHDKPKQAQRIA